jgi:hypothetical protein
MLALVKALEKCYGLDAKIRKAGAQEEDEEFEEGLAQFRRLQNQAIETFQKRAAKATGTDGQAHPVPTSAPAVPTQQKPENGQPQRKEINLFSR